MEGVQGGSESQIAPGLLADEERSAPPACPAICTEKFRQPCCSWCPMVDKEHPPYGTWELVARLLSDAAE